MRLSVPFSSTILKGSMVKLENTKDCGTASHSWIILGPGTCVMHSKIVAKKETFHLFISSAFICLFSLNCFHIKLYVFLEKCNSFLILARRVYDIFKEMSSTNTVTCIIIHIPSTDIRKNSIIKMGTI